MKALRRPSVAAGAINRAVREHGADDLLAAGEALREAHEALLSGDGDAAAVREATAREREAVRDFARLALGEDATASTEEKVRATLHAASVDDEVRERLDAGRLEREAEAGADPMALLAAGAGAEDRRASRAPRSAGQAATPTPRSRRRHEVGAPPLQAGRHEAGPLRRHEVGPLRRPSRAQPSEAERRRAKAAERAQEAADRALTAQAEAETAAERARAALDEAEDGRAEGARGRRGPRGPRARGAARGQGGRGRGRAPPHRGPPGGQGRRVARLARRPRPRRPRRAPRPPPPRAPRRSRSRSSCWRSASRVWSRSGFGRSGMVLSRPRARRCGRRPCRPARRRAASRRRRARPRG